MEFPFNIQFNLLNSSKTITLQAIDGMKFSKLCSKFFQEARDDIDEENTTIYFKINDRQLDQRSNDTLKDLNISNDSTINVSWVQKPSSDQEKMIENSKKRQNNMRKKRRNQREKLLQEPENDPVKDTLIDMAMIGSGMKSKINEGLNEGKYISSDEAIEKKDSDKHFLALGLMAKYLEYLKIEAVIEKDSDETDERTLNFANISLQFLVNGMINYRKYSLKFLN